MNLLKYMVILTMIFAGITLEAKKKKSEEYLELENELKELFDISKINGLIFKNSLLERNRLQNVPGCFEDLSDKVHTLRDNVRKALAYARMNYPGEWKDKAPASADDILQIRIIGYNSAYNKNKGKKYKLEFYSRPYKDSGSHMVFPKESKKEIPLKEVSSKMRSAFIKALDRGGRSQLSPDYVFYFTPEQYNEFFEKIKGLAAPVV